MNFAPVILNRGGGDVGEKKEKEQFSFSTREKNLLFRAAWWRADRSPSSRRHKDYCFNSVVLKFLYVRLWWVIVLISFCQHKTVDRTRTELCCTKEIYICYLYCSGIFEYMEYMWTLNCKLWYSETKYMRAASAETTSQPLHLHNLKR